MSTVVQIPAGKILSCRNVGLDEVAILPKVDQLMTQCSLHRGSSNSGKYNEDNEQHGRDSVHSKSGYSESSQDTLARHPSTFTLPLTHTQRRIQLGRSSSSTAMQQQEDDEAAARLVYASSPTSGGAPSQPLLLRAEDSIAHTHTVAQLHETEYESDDMHGHTDADGAAKINVEGNLDGNSKGGEAIHAELALALALLGEL
jgi:hypothetical protein